MKYLPNTTFLQGGKYKIVRHISSGGFGNTYEGFDVSLDKRVAIKEFFVRDFCSRNQDATLVTVMTPTKVTLIDHLKQKFLEEARTIAKMEHDNIVKVQNLFEENGTAYYVMDYVDGESLSDLLKRRGSLPESEALPIVYRVADALDYMHTQNCFHLDVKPANIMVRRDGKVLLIDFGSSKQYIKVDGEDTSTFAPCYTPGYAPPEQVTPKHTVFSSATDVYALGATLYKMLSGVTPPSAIDLLNEDEVLAPLPNEVSPHVKNCIEKAMVLQRNKRLQSVVEFLAMLKVDGHTVSVSSSEQINRKNIIAENDAVKSIVEKGVSFYKDGNYTSALLLWDKAVKQESTEAMYHVGNCYLKGKGRHKDASEAVWYYRNAANQGCAAAQNALGECYEKGKGVKKDKKEAVKWYYNAAEQGYAEGLINLGLCYSKGNGVKMAPKVAIELFRRAAIQGNPKAQDLLRDEISRNDSIANLFTYVLIIFYICLLICTRLGSWLVSNIMILFAKDYHPSLCEEIICCIWACIAMFPLGIALYVGQIIAFKRWKRRHPYDPAIKYL